MENNFEIIPHIGCHSVKFGMSSEEVRFFLGEPNWIDTSNGKRKEVRDLLTVFYGVESNRVEGIEFYEEAEVFYKGINLFKDSNAYNFLLKEDGAPLESLGTVVLLRLGIALWSLNYPEEPRTIYISKSSTWDVKRDKLKPVLYSFKIIPHIGIQPIKFGKPSEDSSSILGEPVRFGMTPDEVFPILGKCIEVVPMSVDGRMEERRSLLSIYYGEISRRVEKITFFNKALIFYKGVNLFEDSSCYDFLIKEDGNPVEICDGVVLMRLGIILLGLNGVDNHRSISIFSNPSNQDTGQP